MPLTVVSCSTARILSWCLVELQDRWLNPPEWVERIEEPVVGYPPRPVPRTRPQWLADAHAQLDAAVAAAYGWPGEITDDAALHKLLARNRSDCT